MGVLMFVSMACHLLVKQEVAAGRALISIQVPAAPGFGAPLLPPTPVAAGKVVGQKDDIGISIGGGGGDVSITGSIHFGDNAKPKYRSGKVPPSYQKPSP
ncbi:unnamed protein product [Urochloa humidicola]